MANDVVAIVGGLIRAMISVALIVFIVYGMAYVLKRKKSSVEAADMVPPDPAVSESVTQKNNERWSFSSEVSQHEIEACLDKLQEEKIIFGLYDQYYPSPSDPGAYFNYEYNSENDNGTWWMTFGNHGWSGGKYKIKQEVLVLQLLHLARSQQEFEISTKEGLFQYSPEPEEKNKQINEELRQLHSETN